MNKVKESEWRIREWKRIIGEGGKVDDLEGSSLIKCA